VAKNKTAAKKSATKASGRSRTTARKSAAKSAKRKTAATKTVKAATRKAGKATRKTAARGAKRSAGKAAKKAAKKTAKKLKVKLPKTPLKKKELSEFREMLLAKRRTLLGDMSGMEAEALRGNTSTGEHSSMPVHMADIGTDNYEQEFTLGLLESERQLLREIDEALERMAQGTYGVCMGTGDPIGEARLRAKPWAKYSIAYVRKIEQGLVRIPASDYGVSGGENADDLL